MAELIVHNINMVYHALEGETDAINDLNLQIRDGEFLSIVGPSGCGKTTLLSIISGLLKPSTGEIIIGGKQITYPCSQIAYMLQKDQLFEWRTILKNVTLGLEIQNKLSKATLSKVENMLKKYGLWNFRYYYPRQLSGGMRQRVALIRTLAVDPDILLLDEPFSSLDYQTRLAVSDEIYCIIKDEKKTALMVTHDISEAVSLSDRVVVLSKRPAKVKNIYDINFSIDSRTPLKVREAPEFRHYFNIIWKELDVHVE